MNNNFSDAYERLADDLQSKGINVEDVKAKLKSQHIETPSWGYGNSGTRFKVFPMEASKRSVTKSCRSIWGSSRTAFSI